MSLVKIPDANGRKSWRKLLSGVDVNQSGGYAYVGEWLPRGGVVELEPGAYVLVHDVYQANGEWHEYTVLSFIDGDHLQPVHDAHGEVAASGRGWGEQLKSRVLNIVGDAIASPDEVAKAHANNVRGRRSQARAALVGEPAPASAANPRQIVSLPAVSADVKLSREEQFAAIALKGLEPDRQAAVLVHAGLLR